MFFRGSRFACCCWLFWPARFTLNRPMRRIPLPRNQLPKRLVGDYGYWSRTQTPPYSSAQIPFEKLTHINHDGVSFNADGSLSVPSGFLEPELITQGTCERG